MQLKLLRLLFRLLNAISSSAAGRLAVAVFYSPRRFPAANWEKAGIALGKGDTLHFDGEKLAATVWGVKAQQYCSYMAGRAAGASWSRSRPTCPKKGFRVVTFDGPAHGSSVKKRTTLVEFSEAVESAAKQFGPLHGIVGHSFGAAAVAIAMRKGVRAERAVLISCPFSLRHVVSGFAKLVGLPSKSHEKMYPLMERLHRCPESELSFETIGPDLETPCLLIHDAADQYIPLKDGEMVSLTIDGAQIVRTKGLGHMRILQDDGVVARVSQFVCELAEQLSMAA